MEAPKPQTETALEVRRSFAAPRGIVFRAWTHPEALKQWMAPSDAFSVPRAEVDLRQGGRYRIEMKSPEGDVHSAVGTYREVRPPERLVFTWQWENDPAMGETLVTVEFQERGGSTEVRLTHNLFPDAETARKHEQGWTGCLERLGRALAAGTPA